MVSSVFDVWHDSSCSAGKGLSPWVSCTGLWIYCHARLEISSRLEVNICLADVRRKFDRFMESV